MKIKSSLIAFVLAMLVLCAGFTAASPAPPSCITSCINNYNFCKGSCGGDPTCLAECKSDYDCCIVECHGGSCLTKTSTLPPVK
jgi:hypothetical protein